MEKMSNGAGTLAFSLPEEIGLSRKIAAGDLPSTLTGGSGFVPRYTAWSPWLLYEAYGFA